MSYVGSLEQIPAGWFLCDGSNGTPDLRDRFLEGNGTVPVTTIINPGLPNIWGGLNEINDDYGWGNSYSSWGALYSAAGNHREAQGCYDGYGTYGLYFDASRCSSIYGASNTVQPAAYTVYFIIRLK